MTYVRTITNQYVVVDRAESHYVNRKGECSCGGNIKDQCIHFEAVKDFLKQGGKRATNIIQSLLDQELPEECPICEEEVDIDISPSCRRRIWVCSSNNGDNAHFWEWLGNGSIRGFLTRNRPNKLGAYYSQSWEEKRRNTVDPEMHEYFRRKDV